MKIDVCHLDGDRVMWLLNGKRFRSCGNYWWKSQTSLFTGTFGKKKYNIGLMKENEMQEMDVI